MDSQKNELDFAGSSFNTVSSNSTKSELQEIKIVIEKKQAVHVLNASDVLVLEAKGAYTTFYTTCHTEGFVTSKLLGYYCKVINPKLGFYRANRSIVVNLSRITDIVRLDKLSWNIIYDTNFKFEVSNETARRIIDELFHGSMVLD